MSCASPGSIDETGLLQTQNERGESHGHTCLQDDGWIPNQEDLKDGSWRRTRRCYD